MSSALQLCATDVLVPFRGHKIRASFHATMIECALSKSVGVE